MAMSVCVVCVHPCHSGWSPQPGSEWLGAAPSSVSLPPAPVGPGPAPRTICADSTVCHWFSYAILPLLLTVPLGGHFGPQFADKETKVQRGDRT